MSMADRDGLIWFDGEMIPWRDAKVHVLTHTLHYGMGVFEGVRAYETVNGPGIFRLQDHTDRLFRSAHIMKPSWRPCAKTTCPMPIFVQWCFTDQKGWVYGPLT